MAADQGGFEDRCGKAVLAFLEDEAEFAGDGAAAKLLQGFAVDAYVAASWVIESAQGVQQGALAGAVGAGMPQVWPGSMRRLSGRPSARSGMSMMSSRVSSTLISGSGTAARGRWARRAVRGDDAHGELFGGDDDAGQGVREREQCPAAQGAGGQDEALVVAEDEAQHVRDDQPDEADAAGGGDGQGGEQAGEDVDRPFQGRTATPRAAAWRGRGRGR